MTKYYVSYVYDDKELHGHGSFYMNREAGFTEKLIKDLQDQIKKDKNHDSVRIMGIIELKGII